MPGTRVTTKATAKAATEATAKATAKVKVRLNIRLWKETKERLRVAAEKLGVSETAIMEMALRMWFTKEKIPEARITV